MTDRTLSPATLSPPDARDRRPGAAHERLVGAGGAHGFERARDLGAQGNGGRLEVVDDRARSRAPGAWRTAPRRCEGARAGPPPRTRRRSRAGARKARPRARARASGGHGSSRSPAPVASHSPGDSRLGTSAPSSAAIRSGSPGIGASRAATRSNAAASAEPPPMPAATGIRFVIWTRSGGPVPAGGAKRAQRRQRPGCPPRPPRR